MQASYKYYYALRRDIVIYYVLVYTCETWTTSFLPHPHYLWSLILWLIWQQLHCPLPTLLTFPMVFVRHQWLLLGSQPRIWKFSWGNNRAVKSDFPTSVAEVLTGCFLGQQVGIQACCCPQNLSASFSFSGTSTDSASTADRAVGTTASAADLGYPWPADSSSRLCCRMRLAQAACPGPRRACGGTGKWWADRHPLPTEACLTSTADPMILTAAAAAASPCPCRQAPWWSFQSSDHLPGRHWPLHRKAGDFEPPSWRELLNSVVLFCPE